ncbi:MAG: peptidylprolyl isomerase [Gammaproteobacteria bacterium]
MKKFCTSLLSFILLLTSALLCSTANADNPIVKIDTNKGKVLIELFPDKAPETVKNFLHYVNEKKYDNTVFHRIVKDFVNQGGGYNHQYKLVETFPPIKNEADNGLQNTLGTIAMAHTADPHSARNQFFINMADNSLLLDHKDKTPRGWGFCVFGKVIEGMAAMERIARVRTQAHGPFEADAPVFPVSIRSIRLVEKQP